MTDYLFLATIGPVQEFIASARRSRDLWFGSWLLSELAKAATAAIATSSKGGLERLIFPAPASLADLTAGSSFNAANKILARLDLSGEADPAAAINTFGESLLTAMLQRLRTLSGPIFEGIEQKATLDDRTTAEQQIDELLEYYWIALPLPSESAYATTRQQVEALMAARKATRHFAPAVWARGRPKSSLDGQRESVIPEDRYPRSAYSSREDSPEERQRKVQFLYDVYRAGQAERLSGVDLLKRHGMRGQDEKFPSTSNFAATPTLLRLREELTGAQGEQLKSAWERYLELLGKAPLIDEERAWKEYAIFGPYDGSVLFEERLGDLFYDEKLEKRQLDDLRMARSTFFAALAEMNIAPLGPLPYYALLHADGDRMGRVIEHEARQGVVRHRELSQALDGFAGQVRELVRASHGALIYAGGDDVLAFLPVHTALACARALATSFRKKLNGFHDERNNAPTLSVGIAVAHHLDPLSDTLRLAREAEQTAKRRPNKNSLAITVSKRSGVDRTVAGGWAAPDGVLPWWQAFDTRMNRLIELHRREQVPDGAAYQLREIANRLSVPRGDAHYAELERAMRQDAIRIFDHARGGRGEKNLVNELQDDLSALLAFDPAAEQQPMSTAQLADELIVARIFADARDIAEGPLPRDGGER